MDFNTLGYEENGDHSPVVTDPVSLLMQEIDVALNVDDGEVIFDSARGGVMDTILWKLNYSEENIQNTIVNLIQNECEMAKYFNVTTNVSFEKGSVRDIAYLEITVKDSENNIKTSKIYVWR